ncbi:MAG: RNA polymerase sigma factor [Oscillospiraceae bacterium]|jgi:RNA polymerase sigma-70 factor (ECF subfamily)
MNDRQFNEMVGQYERLVYTICYQFTKNHHTAQDLAQETFLSAYSHLASCPAGNEKPWLARIATNKAKDFLKSAYNRRVLAADDTTLPESGDVLFSKQELPEDLTLEREGVLAIEADIRALKEPYHQVAVLYFLQEFSVDEISKRLERPPKTVHTQIWRAKRQLQEKLKGGGP